MALTEPALALGARFLRRRSAALLLFPVALACGGAAIGPSHTAQGTSAIKASRQQGNSREVVLYSFLGKDDGAYPVAGLTADKTGTLYGTTGSGAANTCRSHRCGTVFALIPSGSGYTERVLYRFRGYPADGALPQAPMILDKKGALYGTTAQGGAAKQGTVFRLTPSGSTYIESVLYSFRNGTDGARPFSGLIADKTGALYGTTNQGGGASAFGTVFKLTPSGGGYLESVLHAFRGGTDGANPVAGLTADDTGALYGTTIGGGSGVGTVFKLTPSGRGYSESVVYSFQNKSDGATPSARLITDTTGALYGTTAAGGTNGYGTVFKIVPSGTGYTESVLYSFQNGNDGASPFPGLVADAAGALYGMTTVGGMKGFGTVFKLAPSGSGYGESVLYSFQSGSDGANPYATLIADKTGALYGTTVSGGTSNKGIVFRLTPSSVRRAIRTNSNQP